MADLLIGAAAIEAIGGIMLFGIGFHAREIRNTWFDTIFESMDINQVQARPLSVADMEHLSHNPYTFGASAAEYEWDCKTPSGAFEFTVPGTRPISWVMYPDNGKFFREYTRIGGAKQVVGFELQRKLRNIGEQAHVIWKIGNAGSQD